MKKTTIKFHQGDVQGKSIYSIPKAAVKISQKPIALGEHSGHCHILTGDVELFEHDGKIFAAVGEDGATLQHVHETNFKGDYKTTKVLPKADHHPIKLAPNQNYEFGIHKKYNPFSKIFEKVID